MIIRKSVKGMSSKNRSEAVRKETIIDYLKNGMRGNVVVESKW